MRQKREKMQNGTYMVSSNIIPEIANILCTEETQSLFMEVLEEATTLYRVKISNFVVLRDEFQMVIQTIEETDISLVMQWVKQVFSIRFNRRFNRSGTIWKGRFKSILLRMKDRIIEFIKKLDNLPIRLNLCKEKGEYQYSGAWHIKSNIRHIIKETTIN